MKRIVIVDYGMGNIDSVARAIEEGGAKPQITAKPEDFTTCQGIVLPGVGSFVSGMNNLRAKGLDQILNEQVLNNKIPFLGICLGMQLIATLGLEGGRTKGLGWINADVKRFELSSKSLKIPHVGWNEVHHAKASSLWNGIASGKDFYFVHSFHVVCRERDDVLATTSYGNDFVSAVQKDNVFGVQFHPEKSLSVGLNLIRNFIAMC
ncbi:MAG: imidazole glycerol phosphate synthase subunit HisH [Candidatus Omnitrophota bacterium]